MFIFSNAIRNLEKINTIEIFDVYLIVFYLTLMVYKYLVSLLMLCNTFQ